MFNNEDRATKKVVIDPGHGGTCLSQINYNANNISS